MVRKAASATPKICGGASMRCCAQRTPSWARRRWAATCRVADHEDMADVGVDASRRRRSSKFFRCLHFGVHQHDHILHPDRVRGLLHDPLRGVFLIPTRGFRRAIFIYAEQRQQRGQNPNQDMFYSLARETRDKFSKKTPKIILPTIIFYTKFTRGLARRCCPSPPPPFSSRSRSGSSSSLDVQRGCLFLLPSRIARLQARSLHTHSALVVFFALLAATAAFMSSTVLLTEPAAARGASASGPGGSPSLARLTRLGLMSSRKM